MSFFTTSERLLTWLDVERTLKQRTQLWSRLPPMISSVDCFSDGMEITYSGSSEEVSLWLQDIFGSAYEKENRLIRLKISDVGYQVAFIEGQSSALTEQMPTYPLWRDITYLKSASEESEDIAGGAIRLPEPWTDGPQMVSFHSFKGGVGRTTALMTYVAACLQQADSVTKKILVVDADIEAPGVSFWLDDVNRPKVSFIQFLEGLHYPPADVCSTIDFFADELSKTSINVDGLQRELFILPAALELTDIQDMPVQPSHLARNPVNPWVLTDHLHSLGKRLGVDAVFIDLRAGLSELASPVLFDPRVNHFFVTTVASQSVAGMAEVLKRLYAFNSRLEKSALGNAKPSVILSLLTKELRDAADYQRALEVLGQAYPGDADDPLVGGVEWLEAEFLSTLMSISSVRQALDSLKQSTVLYATATAWSEAIATLPQNVLDVPKEIETSISSAQILFETCQRAQFAENDDVSTMLATEPLRNLGKHYAKEIPNVVMIGAKGAGKTFTFRQLVKSKRWSVFLEKVDLSVSGSVDADIFPVLWSANIDDRPDGDIKRSQQDCLLKLERETGGLLTASAIEREVSAALSNPPSHWDAFWDRLICRQFGVEDFDLQALNAFIGERGRSVILVFDGIEDAFNEPSSGVARDAIQALLKLPGRLSELSNRRLGAIVFARVDYISAAIRQNQGQFTSRYAPFQLQWNPESFLRLAYWLCCQAKIFADDLRVVESLRLEELKGKLEVLWGKKLGTEKSKEAHSARWVFAALCDLKGNVQARDLVRFLKFSAEQEIGRDGGSWSDRVLAPESMRTAIPLCSQEKVEELEKEVAPLREWVKLLKENTISRKVPFSASAMQLNSDLLKSLQEIGIIYEDGDGDLGEERLFLPEIYRSGLGFDTSTTGRPRMQALLKKTLGRMPL
ncbi:ParA family protein [Pseudomonas chlororaphis]